MKDNYWKYSISKPHLNTKTLEKLFLSLNLVQKLVANILLENVI